MDPGTIPAAWHPGERGRVMRVKCKSSRFSGEVCRPYTPALSLSFLDHAVSSLKTRDTSGLTSHFATSLLRSLITVPTWRTLESNV